MAATATRSEEDLSRDLVRYVIFQHSKGNTVSRSEASKQLFAGISAGRLSTAFQNQVWSLAADHLLDVFGFELLPTEKLHKTGAASSLAQVVDGSSAKQGEKSALARLAQAQTSGRYVLRNAFPVEYTRDLVAPTRPLDQARHGLLLAVLCILHLSDGRLSEEALFNHLAALGLKQGLVHDTFGDKWESVIVKDFVAQRWLHSHRDASGQKALAMGEKALAVVSDKDVYLYVAKLFGAAPDPLKLQELDQHEAEKQALRSEILQLSSERAARAAARQQSQVKRSTRTASQKAKAKMTRAGDSDDDDDEEEEEEEATASQPVQRKSQRATAKRARPLLSDSSDDDDDDEYDDQSDSDDRQQKRQRSSATTRRR